MVAYFNIYKVFFKELGLCFRLKSKRSLIGYDLLLKILWIIQVNLLITRKSKMKKLFGFLVLGLSLSAFGGLAPSAAQAEISVTIGPSQPYVTEYYYDYGPGYYYYPRRIYRRPPPPPPGYGWAPPPPPPGYGWPPPPPRFYGPPRPHHYGPPPPPRHHHFRGPGPERGLYRHERGPHYRR